MTPGRIRSQERSFVSLSESEPSLMNCVNSSVKKGAAKDSAAEQKPSSSWSDIVLEKVRKVAFNRAFLFPRSL